MPGPIRGELLGAEQLAERAQEVAASQRVATGKRARRRTPLLARLNETRRILEDAQARLTPPPTEASDVGPAGEWLLDNLPCDPGAHRRGAGEPAERLLPGAARARRRPAGRLSPGLRARHHPDLPHRGPGRSGERTSFVAAFQEVSPLTIGELWAVPAMLRLGLIENVRRMALRTVQRLDEIEVADAAAARIVAARPTRGRAALDAGARPLRLRPAAAHADLRLPLPPAAPGGGRRATRRWCGWSSGSPKRR